MRCAIGSRTTGSRVLDLIGAPGAGKTTLLEHTIRALGPTRVAVIEGDQATDNDARRIAATGCRLSRSTPAPAATSTRR